MLELTAFFVVNSSRNLAAPDRGGIDDRLLSVGVNANTTTGVVVELIIIHRIR